MSEDRRPPPEIAWFAALCDDDYEFLGVPEPRLASSWEHCRDIALAAEDAGFDNILLPSGYALGVDATTFAAGLAPLTSRIQLLLALRMGEAWPPTLARQIASLDRMCDGRLCINVISSDLPGQSMESEARYRRCREYMRVLRDLLDGQKVKTRGEFLDLELEPPRIAPTAERCPPFYFGGFSEAAKESAAREADVFLTWPDTVESVARTVSEMRERAQRVDRQLRYGLRAHVIVRDTEGEARRAAERLVSRLKDETGARIRSRSLDATSEGVRRQAWLRENADPEGYAEPGLWTGIGRARSGAGAALVGDPEQIQAKLQAYRDVGIDAFILSGYPHLEECERVARLVLRHIDHAPLPRR